MSSRPGLVASGDIGGLATALTLHQIGVPCLVLESVRAMRPLGVGINLQPNAVRELSDLGITEAELDEGGKFDYIDDVIPSAERAAFMADYKAAAGFAMESLNSAPPIIAPSSHVMAGA